MKGFFMIYEFGYSDIKYVIFFCSFFYKILDFILFIWIVEFYCCYISLVKILNDVGYGFNLKDVGSYCFVKMIVCLWI